MDAFPLLLFLPRMAKRLWILQSKKNTVTLLTSSSDDSLVYLVDNVSKELMHETLDQV